mmetsp:Transcript_108899/g.283997  ORF Transcript_108899/g.283997 Transcript_108899/m.283997 type:complete len:321 (-) Transcript_108899:417-1379(-)
MPRRPTAPGCAKAVTNSQTDSRLPAASFSSGATEGSATSISSCCVSTASFSAMMVPTALKSSTTPLNTRLPSLKSASAGQKRVQNRQNSAGDFSTVSATTLAWLAMSRNTRTLRSSGTWSLPSSMNETATSFRGSSDFMTCAFSRSTPATIGRSTSARGLALPTSPSPGVVGPPTSEPAEDLRPLLEVFARLAWAISIWLCCCARICATLLVTCRCCTSGMVRLTASGFSPTVWCAVLSIWRFALAAWKCWYVSSPVARDRGSSSIWDSIVGGASAGAPEPSTSASTGATTAFGAPVVARPSGGNSCGMKTVTVLLVSMV